MKYISIENSLNLKYISVEDNSISLDRRPEMKSQIFLVKRIILAGLVPSDSLCERNFQV